MERNGLRDELLKLEPYPEDLKMNIRDEIALTVERPVKTWEWPLLALACVVVGSGAAFIAVLWVSDAGRFNDMTGYTYWSTRATLVLFATFAIAFFSAVFWTLKHRKMRLNHLLIMGYAVFGFLSFNTAAEILFTSNGPDNSLLGGLVIAVAVVVLVRIEAVEQRLRERALRNELALAELAELVADRETRSDWKA